MKFKFLIEKGCVIVMGIQKLRISSSIFFFLFGLLTVNNGCKKFVQVDPPITQIVSSTVYTTDGSAIAAISGIYSQMISSSNTPFCGGSLSITALCGLSADELINYSTNIDPIAFYTNSLLSNNTTIQGNIWSPIYQYIYYVNSVIEGLDKSVNLTPSVKQQLTGEAEFIRAFCNFYLVNLFGEIPLILSTDYRVNNIAPRISVSQVYNQILIDLKNAQGLLSSDYSFSNGEKVRPNKWTATALLARTYLFMGDWVDAELQADSVINNVSMYSLDSLNAVFLGNSTEAIWQLEPNAPNQNTWEGNTFILVSTPQLLSLSNQVVNSFETGDNRESEWVGSLDVNGTTYFYPYKYKVQSSSSITEYSMVFRLAEQYLIRAEARAQQTNLIGAAADLNMIRNRAGLANTAVSTQLDLLSAIFHERQVELFTEWGNRWLDLKRTNQADAILGTIKSPYWKSSAVLYPIPQSEILNDPNLTQNSGY